METFLLMKVVKTLSYLLIFALSFNGFFDVPKERKVIRFALAGLMLFSGTNILEIVYHADRISWSQLGLNICVCLLFPTIERRFLSATQNSHE